MIPSTWELPPEITSRFGESTGRQRFMEHAGHLLLVLHKVPEPESNERQGVLFWRRPDGGWETSEKGAGLSGLKEHVVAYATAVEGLDSELDSTRDADGLFRILSITAPVQRAAKNLHRVLQAAREAAAADREIITLRDQAEGVERTADLLRIEARNALDFDIARRAEDQAAKSEEISLAAHRLNILAALFLPITAVSSVLGVNLPTGMEDWITPSKFWMLMGLSLLLGLFLKGRIVRRVGS